jgi:hypothetical protein
MDNWIYVGAAYALTWVVVAGYLLHVTRATRRAAAALERAGRSAHEGGR